MSFIVDLPVGATGFGERVRICRMLVGLRTQSALAKKAGIMRNRVSYIEQGGPSQSPSFELVKKLADAIGCDSGWLWDESGPRPAFLDQREYIDVYGAGAAAARAGVAGDAPSDLDDVSAGWWVVGHEHQIARTKLEAVAS